jgi:uncharacterized repeat protein (TIGR01451 family)
VKKLFFSVAVATVLSLILCVTKTEASQRCEVQYGGEVVCVPTDIDINKKVRVPDEAWKALGIEDECSSAKKAKKELPEKCEWRDNFVLTDDYKFAPLQEVSFKISVENVSKNTFDKVEIRDLIPSGLELLSNQNKFEFENFKPGEKKEFHIQARIAAADKLEPKEQDVVCLTNKAEVLSNAGTFQGEDSSQLCVSKKKKVTALPKTGPEHIGLFMLGFVTTGIAGVILLRRFK